MITEQTTIRPVKPRMSAIQIARECYLKWNAPVTFEDDIKDYLESGIVIVRPDLFGLAKLIDLGPQINTDETRIRGSGIRENPCSSVAKNPAWFVRMAVGNLGELLSNLPFYLPKICFCRKRDGRVRVYSLRRMAQLSKTVATENHTQSRDG